MLKLYDEFAYDEGFFKVVTDTTKKFEINQEDKCTETYYRINDVQDSYKPIVTIVKDNDQNMGSVDKLNLEYWDYWREDIDEGGTKYNQFLFVEMDRNNGWFQIWRGQEINLQDITIL